MSRHSHSPNKIALCVIAKNEAAMLPGLLESVKGAVDQMIVVDTGSEDETIEIAASYGAKVVHFPWNDSFADARNAALPHVTAQWVLALDADERLTPASAKALRDFAQQKENDCGLLSLHNATQLTATPEQVLSGAYRREAPVLLSRFFRKTPDLKWEGVVHETPSTWVRSGHKCAQIPNADILHYGYVPEIMEGKSKKERNLNLLRARVKLEPDNPVVYTYLTGELIRGGHSAEAEKVVDQGWILMEKAFASGKQPFPPTVLMAGMRARFAAGRRDWEKAFQTLDQSLQWSGNHPNLTYLQGHIRLTRAMNGEPDQLPSAMEWLQKTLTLPKVPRIQPPFPGVEDWLPRIDVGLIHLLQNEIESAYSAFSQVLKENPESNEGFYGLVETLLTVRDLDRTLPLLEPRIQAAVKEGEASKVQRDLWYLTALFYMHAGMTQEAIHFLERCFKPGATWASPHRLIAAEELRAAFAFAKGRPQSGRGPWGTLGALITHRPNPYIALNDKGEPVQVVPASPMTAAVVKDAVHLLLEQERPQDLEPLMSPRARAMAPGIDAWIRETLTELGLDWKDEGEPNFIFIGGPGRSGTTLFRAMLSAHPNLWCGPEAKIIPLACGEIERWRKALGPSLTDADIDPMLLRDGLKGFLAATVSKLGPPGKRIAEKTPHNLLYMSLLGELFPRAKFIHVIRDGRAVAESLVRQNWFDPSTGEKLDYCKDIRRAAKYWSDVTQQIRAQAGSVRGRYLELRYEALVQNPKSAMEQVLAFLDEPWSEAVLHHEKADVPFSRTESSTRSAREAVNTSRIEAWRRLPERDLAIIEQEAGATLRMLGYVGPTAANQTATEAQAAGV